MSMSGFHYPGDASQLSDQSYRNISNEADVHSPLMVDCEVANCTKRTTQEETKSLVVKINMSEEKDCSQVKLSK